jgi:hypothetical protein
MLLDPVIVSTFRLYKQKERNKKEKKEITLREGE